VRTPARAAWGGAGGAEAFERLVDRFYRRVLVEPLLQPPFVSMPHEHIHNVALWLGEVFGGPSAYSEGRGGHPAVIRAHTGYAITEEQRERWAELMFQTAAETCRRSRSCTSNSRPISTGARRSPSPLPGLALSTTAAGSQSRTGAGTGE
jgi:truncated hemoglobin YjbI